MQQGDRVYLSTNSRLYIREAHNESYITHIKRLKNCVSLVDISKILALGEALELQVYAE